MEFLGIDLSNSQKAKFLSRFFGTFYEELIGECLRLKGDALKGRPSIYDKSGNYQRITFDYTVEKKGRTH